MKKARKQYIDQLILNNYNKEKKLQEEREERETILNMNNTTGNVELQSNYVDISKQNNHEIENEEIIQETFEEDVTFNDIFNSRLDNKFEPFYGNSSFAPF